MKQFACVTTSKSILPESPLEKKIKVIDLQGRPLEGVHIITGNSRYNTITNQLGTAFIQHHGYEDISFSYLGKETKTINIRDIQTDVVLDDSIEALDDVLIIAKPKTSNAGLWILGAIALGTFFMLKKNKPKKVNL